jgi:hypothetical protein
MIKFRILHDDHPALVLSPLLRAAERTLAFVRDDGPIGLTETKAFKRSFVTWALRNFDWQGWSESELLRHSKVINEADFPPLELLHFLLIQLKLARHVKGEFRLTQLGKELSVSRGKLFEALIPFFILHIDHASYGRFDDRPFGKWDVWLNVLNIELATPQSEAHLFRVFYGEPPERMNGGWRVTSAFSHCVLQPLEWSGLIVIEDKAEGGRMTNLCAKTALWPAAMELDHGPMFAVSG